MCSALKHERRLILPEKPLPQLYDLLFSDNKPDGMKPIDLALVSHLVARQTSDHWIWDSRATLAMRLCCHPNTIATSVAWLEKLGPISTNKRKTRGLFSLAGLLPRVLGPSFAEAATALRWLCVIPLLRFLHYTWGTAITARMSQWRRTVAQATAAALNVGLCAWWIPRWQWRGAAAASLMTDGVLVVMSVGIWWMWVRRRVVEGKNDGVEAKGIGRVGPGWIE